ncbi:MAG: PIN domain-containing protein, partial [Candidatus Margulisbacteria bacterium]|nr:PIN domain-containing protein [Candidatus Margulisiibacteriota bacterium]
TYLKGEPGWERVKNVIWDAYKKKTALFLSCVNLGEIYYIIYRNYSPSAADQAISMIKLWPLRLIDAKMDMAIIAGRVKAENALSYADAYVVAAALSKKAAIITGDPEFKQIEDLVEVQWLPSNKS